MKKINIKFNKKTILIITIILEVLIIIGLVFVLFFYKDAADERLPIKTLPFLKTEGQDIVNENGNKVFLKGVNFGAWMLWEGCALVILDCPAWPEHKLREEMEKRMSKENVDRFFNTILDNFIQEDDFVRVKDLGLNFVRLDFHHRYVKENQLTKLDEAIHWAEQHEVYVILNMHATPGAQAPAYFADSDGNAYLWDSPEYQEEFLQLWEILAKRYKDNPVVAGYEIINEPVARDGAKVTDLYQRTIERIRKIDPDHIIFLNGNEYASDFSIFPEALAENTVYVFHTYDRTYNDLQNTMARQDYLGFQEKYNVPLMCNEFDMYEFTEYFAENNIHWALWTFKSLNEAPPFYSAPENNVWKNWITSLGQNNLSVKIELKSQINEIINTSSLSEVLKNKLLTSVENNQLKGLKNNLSVMQAQYPADADELARVSNEIFETFINFSTTADMVWLDNLANSLNSMSEKEYKELMESLQTKYWVNDEYEVSQGNENTDMICRLMGEGQTEDITGDVWEGDLGITFMHNNQLYLITGDTGGGENFSPNAMAYTNDLDASDCLDLTWLTKTNKGPDIFFPIITPDSTVPGGAISFNNNIYVFMMDVTDWTHPATARSLLVKSEDNGQTSTLIWEGEVDNKFINISPIISTHPTNSEKQAVYLMASGKYRQSPVYLAYSEIYDIEDKTKYKYYIGLENNEPQWSNSESDAMPIVPDVKVGELSTQWNNYLNKWLLAFIDYSSSDIYFRYADNPWGPWSEGKFVYSGSEKYDWYSYNTTKIGTKNPWGIPYAPYLLPSEYSSEDSNVAYFVLSLWNPYTIFLMEADLDKIFE